MWNILGYIVRFPVFLIFFILASLVHLPFFVLGFLFKIIIYPFAVIYFLFDNDKKGLKNYTSLKHFDFLGELYSDLLKRLKNTDSRNRDDGVT